MTPAQPEPPTSKTVANEKFDKAELVSDLSHELRTILGGVIGINELLLTSELSVHQRQLSQTIEQSSKTLLLVLNDVVELSRMELKKVSSEIVPFDLKGLVSEIVPQLDYLLKDKQSKLDISFNSVPPLIVTDQAALRQIIFFLLLRTVKASSGETVQLSITCDDDTDNLYISTSGSMGEYDHEHLTTLNQPLDSVRKHDSRWLSLYLCHCLVTKLDGTCGAKFTGTNCELWANLPVVIPNVQG